MTTYADVTAERPMTMVLHYAIDVGVDTADADWAGQDKSLRANYCSLKDKNGLNDRVGISYRFEYSQGGAVRHKYLLSSC